MMIYVILKDYHSWETIRKTGYPSEHHFFCRSVHGNLIPGVSQFFADCGVLSFPQDFKTYA